ncbi:hypothetical protein DV515_00009556 [Chloebia gouldiae]|uniref:Uncharacterized protein n=1 Tax=Chloebia gouldiae TaxID=44316 RepID=A0A3L8SCG5_CHLGU|nr:hypothetical protein DV515_00009556 [Chloebia gouldiae]
MFTNSELKERWLLEPAVPSVRIRKLEAEKTFKSLESKPRNCAFLVTKLAEPCPSDDGSP